MNWGAFSVVILVSLPTVALAALFMVWIDYCIRRDFGALVAVGIPVTLVILIFATIIGLAG